MNSRIKKSAPAFDKVRTSLLSWIKTHEQEALPSIRRLAQLNAVSTRTVYLVLEQLKKEELVHSKPGLGNFPVNYAKSIPQSKSAETRTITWLKVYQAIESDLAAGHYGIVDALPSTKSLSVQYQCSPVVIRKVLQILVSKGIVNQQGRQFTPVHQVSLRIDARPTIRLLAYARQGSFPMETNREQDFFRAVEEDVHHHGLQLELVGYDDHRKNPRYYVADQDTPFMPKAPKHFLGTLLAPWHMKNGDTCLEHLIEEGHPVSIWRENSTGSRVLHQGQLVRHFDIGYGQDPGYAVAQALFKKGHSHIAFISPFHASSWSQGRWLGIQQFASQKKIKALSFLHHALQNPWGIRDQLESNTQWIDQREKWLQASLIDLSYRKTQLNELYTESHRDAELYALCQSLFLHAYQSGATAWVLANDLIAILAQQFLAKQTLRRKPMLVGFDNSIEAQKLGISSFEFDARSLVRAMLGYLISPKSELYKKADVIRPKGYLVWR